MRQEQKQLKLNVKSVTEDNKVINQQTLTITKHKNDKKYLIISKNDFGKNLRINAGIFNKKTRFIVTENHSLLVYDNDIKEMSVKEIQEKNPFLIYFIPIFTIKQNYQIMMSDEVNGERVSMLVNLDFELGRAIGRKMKGLDYKSDLETIAPNITEIQEHFLLKLIPDPNKINFDKRIVVSSNYKFLLGILYELFEEKLFIKNINLYLLTTILNMLGASYSIRKQNDEFYIRFKLPLFFKKFLKNLKHLKNPEKNKNNVYNRKLKMIRNKKYIIDENNQVKLVTYNEFKKYYFDAKHTLKKDKDLKYYINLGICELLPAKDFKFIEINYGDVYDFVTEGRRGATNYVLPGLPLLKNSDGDILALIAIWTEDAAKDAEEKFGISKRTVISELDGKPFSWIDIDAVLGLYNFTK